MLASTQGGPWWRGAWKAPNLNTSRTRWWGRHREWFRVKFSGKCLHAHFAGNIQFLDKRHLFSVFLSLKINHLTWIVVRLEDLVIIFLIETESIFGLIRIQVLWSHPDFGITVFLNCILSDSNKKNTVSCKNLYQREHVLDLIKTKFYFQYPI